MGVSALVSGLISGCKCTGVWFDKAKNLQVQWNSESEYSECGDKERKEQGNCGDAHKEKS